MASRIVNRGRMPRNNATSPRRASDRRKRRALGQPRELDRTVHGDVVVPRRLSRQGTPASYEVGGRPAPPPAAPPSDGRRRGTIPPWPATPVAPPGFHGKNSLAPARMACRIRSGSAAVAIANTGILLCRRAGARWTPSRTRRRTGCPQRRDPDLRPPRWRPFHDPQGTPPPAAIARLPFEFFVVRDDCCCKLRHSFPTFSLEGCHWTSRMVIGFKPVGAGPLPSRIPAMGMMRPQIPFPCVLSRKNPIQFAVTRSAPRPFLLPLS